MLLRARVGRARRFIRILRDLVSRSAAERSVGQASAAPTGRAPGRTREAVEAAKRLAAGLPDAMLGATARLQVGLEQGTVGGLEPLAERLASQQPGGLSRSDDELKRALLAALRVVAADYAQTAQAAVDLTVARARATFLERGLQPPFFDVHVRPLSFTLPSGAERDELLELARGAPRLLRDDLARQAGSLAAEVTRVCDELVHTGRESAFAAEDRQPSRADLEAAAALRLLEDDLVRLDHLLGRSGG
jgi:hypothetical protein